MDTKYFRAAALSLGGELSSAPTLSAVGEHEIAKYIVQCAKAFGVPVVERSELCDAVSDLELDEAIPAELYEIAAAVLIEVGAVVPKAKNTA